MQVAIYCVGGKVVKGMSTRKLLIFNLLLVVLIAVGGFVAYYFYNQSMLYVKTDNAQVTGQQIAIAAPASGQLVDWKGTEGTHFSAGDTVGSVQTTVQTPAGSKQVSVPIKMPADGTVVMNNAVEGQIVAAGVPLAYAYDLHHLWVTANIKETEISDVKVGQTVDVYVDADPGVTFKGTVTRIGLATASTFSLMPSTNTSANFTKVTQVIPVTISLSGYEGSYLVPGMSASVRIHK
jgi:multidrug resistance efflux pump